MYLVSNFPQTILSASSLNIPVAIKTYLTSCIYKLCYTYILALIQDPVFDDVSLLMYEINFVYDKSKCHSI